MGSSLLRKRSPASPQTPVAVCHAGGGLGALVIWLVYGIYLHARITYGWVGRPSAVIAVMGFFVILAGFLGVNLGWFADGLHSYGAA